MKNIKFKLLAFVILAFGLQSCEDLLQIDPPSDQISSNIAFADSMMITKQAEGIYAHNRSNPGMCYYIPIFVSAITDELEHRDPSTFSFLYTNNYNARSTFLINNTWTYLYESIYISNSFIDNMAQTGNIISEERKALYNADARFFRAYAHLSLAMLYDNVPYITTSDPNVTKTIGQTPKKEVIENVAEELRQIEIILDKSSFKRNNAYISVHAVRALLSRIYLYQEKWNESKDMASKVINESGASLGPLADVFIRNNKGTIFRLSTKYTGGTSYNGYTQYGLYITATNYSYVTPELANSFEEGDLRKSWISIHKSYNEATGDPRRKYRLNKYLLRTASAVQAGREEDYIMIRLAEILLNRAEANINLGNFAEARTDINAVRTRAGLDDITTNDVDELRKVLYHERRIELCCEDAFRWYDIIRWGIIDEEFAKLPTKTTWTKSKEILPIPYDEIGNNHNLVQNPGYQ